MTQLTRRDFIGTSSTAAAGLALGALTSARAAGANERLSVGIVGPGGRGRGLLKTFFDVSPDSKAELTAVCDLWSRNRERAVDAVKQAAGGRQPRVYKRP